MKYMKDVDIRDATEDCIAHGCNCQGVMGSGVALAVKNEWPGAYDAYISRKETKGLKLGTYVPYLDKECNTLILNLLTQDRFGTDKRQVNYAAIVTSISNFMEDCIEDLVARNLSVRKIEIAIPKIGAGLGGGSWEIIEMLLKDLEDLYTIPDHGKFLEFTVYYFVD